MRYEFECVEPTCSIGTGSSRDENASLACRDCGAEMVPIYQGESLTNDEILEVMRETLAEMKNV